MADWWWNGWLVMTRWWLTDDRSVATWWLMPTVYPSYWWGSSEIGQHIEYCPTHQASSTNHEPAKRPTNKCWSTAKQISLLGRALVNIADILCIANIMSSMVGICGLTTTAEYALRHALDEEPTDGEMTYRPMSTTNEPLLIHQVTIIIHQWTILNWQ